MVRDLCNILLKFNKSQIHSTKILHFIVLPLGPKPKRDQFWIAVKNTGQNLTFYIVLKDARFTQKAIP